MFPRLTTSAHHWPTAVVVVAICCGHFGPASTEGDVAFTSGELLDVYTAMMGYGFQFPDQLNQSTLFLIYNAELHRYMYVAGGNAGNHVSVIATAHGSTAVGRTFWLKRIEQGFVTLAADVNDGGGGVGNGAATGAELFTGDWTAEPSHHYAIRAYDSFAMLQNRGNGLCVSADAVNNQPLVVAPCSTTDVKQQWQFCQQLDDVFSAYTCWPNNVVLAMDDDTSTDE